tara:strand:+ start:2432 stop:5386 length:2955 start_codon:yes stop_codon:yes gene_type:complete
MFAVGNIGLFSQVGGNDDDFPGINELRQYLIREGANENFTEINPGLLNEIDEKLENFKKPSQLLSNHMYQFYFRRFNNNKENLNLKKIIEKINKKDKIKNNEKNMIIIHFLIDLEKKDNEKFINYLNAISDKGRLKFKEAAIYFYNTSPFLNLLYIKMMEYFKKLDQQVIDMNLDNLHNFKNIITKKLIEIKNDPEILYNDNLYLTPYDNLQEIIEEIKETISLVNYRTNKYQINFIISNIIKDVSDNPIFISYLNEYKVNGYEEFKKAMRNYKDLYKISPFFKIFLNKFKESNIGFDNKKRKLGKVFTLEDLNEWLTDIANLEIKNKNESDIEISNKIYKEMFKMRMQLKQAFNKLIPGGGNKLMEIIEKKKNIEREILKKKAGIINEEFDEFVKTTNKDKSEFLQLKFDKLCKSVEILAQENKEQFENLFAYLDIDFVDQYGKEDLCEIVKQEINRNKNANLVCDNEDDPIKLEEVKGYPPDDIIKFYFPNKSQPICYSRTELTIYLSNPDNIRADWVQNPNASHLIEDGKGYGGLPGNRRFRIFPYEFKLFITEDSYNFINTFNNLKEYKLVKYEDVRVGNINASFGISESHGQDVYPTYVIFANNKNIGYESRYLAGPELGRGSFGKVRMVYDTVENKIKTAKSAEKENNNAYIVTLNEAITMRSLKNFFGQCSPHVVCYDTHFNTKDFLTEKDVFVIIMEYIDGCDIYNIGINNMYEQEHILKNTKIHILYKLIIDVLEAIEYIHSYGVAHKDITPKNIMYDRKNNIYKLIDFSYSCIKDECLQSDTYNKKFISPEYKNTDKKDLDFFKKNDLFAFGLSLLRLLEPYLLEAYEFIRLYNSNKDEIDYTVLEQLFLQIEMEGIRVNNYNNNTDAEYLISVIKKLVSLNPEERKYSLDEIKEKYSIFKEAELFILDMDSEKGDSKKQVFNEVVGKPICNIRTQQNIENLVSTPSAPAHNFYFSDTSESFDSYSQNLAPIFS